MSDDLDLFVIGAGSGGVRAARVAAEHGAKVMIAEEYRVGGTCVIRGCVPKKLLAYASRFSREFADAAGYGWSVSPPRFDWPGLIANKDREIARLEALAADLKLIARNGRPSSGVLASAPVIYGHTVATRSAMCLKGIVSGHPKLASGHILTSELFVISHFYSPT